MSLKVRSETIGKVGSNRDAFGLPVTPRKNGDTVDNSPRVKSYGVGVRVPNLRELNGKYVGREKPSDCRFDIVERVTTIIKPGSYGVDRHEMIAVGTQQIMSEEPKTTGVSRQPTFMSTVSTTPRNEDSSILDRIGPYHWDKYVKSAKERDARDVLYRNTYCLDPHNLRYNSVTLPRLTTPGAGDRPWTVGSDEITPKNSVPEADHSGEYSKIVYIEPHKPRGTVVKFRECMKPSVYGSDGKAFEVRRYNSQRNGSRNVFPLIKHDFRRSPRIQERPLKFESSRYFRESKGTLFTKHILPAYKRAFDRDYSSAETFKEYLESLQQAPQSNIPGMHPSTGFRFNDNRMSADYNRVLQSVMDVNLPAESQEDASSNQGRITVEIKPSSRNTDRPIMPPKAHTIDNLSSVHGSVINARSYSQGNIQPFSSSIKDGDFMPKTHGIVLEPRIEENSSAVKSYTTVHTKNNADDNGVHESDGSVVSNKSLKTPVVLPTVEMRADDADDDNDESPASQVPANSPVHS
ncbi:uncharacterized protein LOC127851374 [Dreissena polymorpha]|uniref:Uncharacterized protein n=1 Tax=Dreissena polymorpha TaxID=45954 RepID=A0A9D4CZ92_DREPO|nr:uncharacterized protein LOC127851374 [Dreissena polymorpha]XP_052241072.1 uncharacterized protein LOC127851374 [Dreissena polymorpha]KAH3736231.1 hypothetical protein DPMN_042794 [Dreissena polymorpha]